MHHSCDNSVMTMGFSNNVMELLNSHLLVSGHTVTSGPLLSFLCSNHAQMNGMCRGWLVQYFLWRLKLQRYILYTVQSSLEAEFLDKIKTKVFRVFLLAIHSPLYSFALRFIFLQTHVTSYSFYSSFTVHNKGERRKPIPPSLWFKKSRILKSENSQDYAQKPQRNWTFMNTALGLELCTLCPVTKELIKYRNMCSAQSARLITTTFIFMFKTEGAWMFIYPFFFFSGPGCVNIWKKVTEEAFNTPLPHLYIFCVHYVQ